MIKIRPVSELRNSFPKIEDLVTNQDETVYLTKNGTGVMVVMSIEKYSSLIKAVGETSAIATKKSTRRTAKNVISDEINASEVLLNESISSSDIDNLWKRENNID